MRQLLEADHLGTPQSELRPCGRRAKPFTEPPRMDARYIKRSTELETFAEHVKALVAAEPL